jgi:hypothetical protein
MWVHFGTLVYGKENTVLVLLKYFALDYGSEEHC